MADPTWHLQAAAPDAEGMALVADTTGWPPGVAGPSPLCWSQALMTGVSAALGDARWAIDPLTLRVADAMIAVDLEAGSSALDVRAQVRQVLDLGELSGLDLDVAVGPVDTDGSWARGSFTVAGRGAGLTGGARPQRSRSDDAVDRTGPGEAVTTTVVIDPDRVDRFTHWSGDRTPFHTDPEAARAAGLPAPIAPGLYVLGLIAAAAATADDRAVQAVNARFVRPTVIGDQLTITVHPRAQDGRRAVTAEGPNGPVVRHAWTRPT